MSQITIKPIGTDIEIGNKLPYLWVAPYIGLGEAEIRMPIELNAGEDGGFLAGTPLYGTRQLPITIHQVSACEDFVTERRKLAAAFPFKTPIEILIQDEDKNQYMMTVYRTNPINPQIESLTNAIWDIELVALDPTIYSYTGGVPNSSVVHRPVLGGLLWDSDGLHWYSNGLHWTVSSDAITVVNSGDASVYPQLILISGTANNPSLQNQTVGRTLAFNVSLGASDTIAVDMQKQVALLNPTINNYKIVENTGTNLRNNMTSSDFWWLISGENRIMFNANSDGDTGGATIYWADGYKSII